MPAEPSTPIARPLPRGLYGGEVSDRYQEFLEAAALLFAARGYLATSVRDIGARVGLPAARSTITSSPIGDWYREGRRSPAEIGQPILLIFRHQIGLADGSETVMTPPADGVITVGRG